MITLICGWSMAAGATRPLRSIAEADCGQPAPSANANIARSIAKLLRRIDKQFETPLQIPRKPLIPLLQDKPGPPANFVIVGECMLRQSWVGEAMPDAGGVVSG